jgi:hypothetical protein
MRELDTIFLEVEKTPAVADELAAYGACMSEAGFTTPSHAAIYQQALDKFPRADLGMKAMENDPHWAAAVAFEKAAAVADATCLQPAQDQAFAAGAAKLQAYVAKNRAKLDEAESGWADLRR